MTHNSYLQVSAEVGILGFILFLVLIGRSLRSFWGSATRSDSNPLFAELRVMASGIMVGFFGHLLTAYFLTQGFSVYFALFFALGAIVRRIRGDLSASGELIENRVREAVKRGAVKASLVRMAAKGRSAGVGLCWVRRSDDGAMLPRCA